MGLGELLFRLLFPRHHAAYQKGLFWRYTTIEKLNDATVSREEVLDWLADTDWIFVGTGGDMLGDRVRENEGQCPCETDWDLTGGTVILNAMPNQNDITALYATIAESELGACSGRCLPMQTFSGKWYSIMKNTKTGQFRLHASKRVQWHCEIPGGRGLAARPETLRSGSTT